MADIIVAAGGNLQTALNSAAGGDRILLEPGATFTGNFTFPTKSSAVTLTSNSVLVDQRIAPGDAALLATIKSGNTSLPIYIGANNNWVLDGLRFEQNVGGAGAIIEIQGGNNITMRRLLISTVDDGVGKQKRFCLGNGTNITLHQCYIDGMWYPGEDSQAYAAWDGAGPHTITDSYLCVASENILFGGADASSDAKQPADILVQGNFCTKRNSWRAAGTPWQVKNLFELKSARRAIIRNNIFENHWGYEAGGAQPGYAIVFTPRNQDGTAPFTVIDDVLFENNIIRYVTYGFSILGYDDINTSRQTKNIIIQNNLWMTTGARLGAINSEVLDVRLEHNTHVNINGPSGVMLYLLTGGIKPEGSPARNANFSVGTLICRNNMLHGTEYGVFSSVGAATTAMNNLCLSHVFQTNVMGFDVPESSMHVYHTSNTKLGNVAYFAEMDSLDQYLLKAASVYNNAATDGLDIGWLGMGVALPNPGSGGGGGVTEPVIPSGGITVTVNAGFDQTIVWPANSVSICGTAVYP